MVSCRNCESTNYKATGSSKQFILKGSVVSYLPKSCTENQGTLTSNPPFDSVPLWGFGKSHGAKL